VAGCDSRDGAASLDSYLRSTSKKQMGSWHTTAHIDPDEMFTSGSAAGTEALAIQLRLPAQLR